MATDSNYLRFERDTSMEVGTTQVWLVISKSRDEVLGSIRWYPPWRQYAFRPASATVWNTECLADVQQVISRLMAERRGR